jgi:hypothetical protein
MKSWSEEEVRHVPRDDGAQSLDQISSTEDLDANFNRFDPDKIGKNAPRPGCC